MVGARLIRHPDSRRVSGNQEKKENYMFKKDSRKGLALGGIFALLASLFTVAPAAQADEDGLVIAPEYGTSYTMLVTEEFVLNVRLGSNVDKSNESKVRYIIGKPAGPSTNDAGYILNTHNTNSGTIPSSGLSNTTGLGASSGRNYVLSLSHTVSSAISTSFSTDTVNKLVLRPVSYSGNLADVTSVSPAVSVTVTAFLDLTPDGLLDGTEPSTTVTVNFVPWSAMGTTLSLTQPVEGDRNVTASAALSGVNFEQLNGKFAIWFTTTGYNSAYASGSKSASISPAAVARGELSHSETLDASAGSPANGLAADSSVSAFVIYDHNGTDPSTTVGYLATSKKGATTRSFADWTFSAGATNIARDTDTEGDVRVNSAFEFTAKPYTGSTTVSVAVVPTMTLTYSGTITLSTDKWISIEGTKYTQSSLLPTVSGVVLPAGTNTINVETSGWDGDEPTVTMNFSALNKVGTYALDWAASTYTLEGGDSAANAQPGAAVTLAWDVEDQWGVASPNSNHRVVAYWVGDANFSSSATSSFAVSGGASTVTMTPTSTKANSTGSTTLRVSLQTQALASGLWVTNETENVTVVVSTLTGGFTTSNVASKSASISYAVASGAYSWSPAFSGTTAVGGQDVVISAPSVAFKSATGKTASGTITVKAGSDGAFTFYAASALSGTHTISMVAGGQTTTSLLVVTAPLASAGKSISFDKTEILAGQTTTITGTLVDANGNGVYTGTTASILVKWTGKGLAFNLPTDTDADGEFEFQVLALSSEVGDSAVSATYMPASSATDEDNITAVAAIDIVKSLTEAAADQKITVGTFKGYVAIYTKGYMGQKLSAKVAGKWLVVDPIAAYKSNDYSRTVRLTGAGYTITVDLYIDGAFVRSEVVTTK